MKHSFKITFYLIILFIITQLIGLTTINLYHEVTKDPITEEVTVYYPPTAIGEAPQIKNKSNSFIYISMGVFIGTLLLLLLIKLNAKRVWKFWFLVSVFVAIFVTLGVYLRELISFILAVILSWWKIYRPNILIHNLTEILIYTGITIIFLPILNIFSVVILLIIISIYDMYAVWKSKHMIKLAKFQAKSNIFAGLFIPYLKNEQKSNKTIKDINPFKKIKKDACIIKTKKVKSAILGGGDIAFPLLFSSVVMVYLIESVKLLKSEALLMSSIITITTTFSLILLFWKSKENRFYPAMPFITIGCFVGLAIIHLILKI